MQDKEVSKDLMEKMASAVYLQVSTISQGLIFVTRARGWSFFERPGFLLVAAFLVAQLIASVISATVSWDLAGIREIGWGWTGVIWLFNIVTYMLLDPIKFAVRSFLTGSVWQGVFNQRTAFGTRREEMRGISERWAQHGRSSSSADMANLWKERNSFRDLNYMAEEAKKRAQILRLREQKTNKNMHSDTSSRS